MFKYRIIEDNPLAIRKIGHGANATYTFRKLSNGFVRVFPETWKEVGFLQTLEIGYNLHAPYNGDGVIVMAKFLPK